MGLLSFFDKLLSSPNPIFDHRVDSGALLVRGQFDPDRIPDWAVTRQADWRGWDTEKARDAARKSVTVFACATIIGDAVAEAHLQVETKAKDQWNVAIDRPSLLLQQLLDRPNPFMEDAEFDTLLVFQQAIMGYAVVEKVRGAGNLPIELWPLRADWLSQRHGSSEYEYTIPGKPARSIPADDLIWLPWRHDGRMEQRGISPVTVAAREIGIDSMLTDWLNAFLVGGGIPLFVLTSPDPIMDDSTVEVIQTRWEQKYGGSKAYGKLPVLHGGWDIHQVGGDVNEMAWPDLRGLTELKICSAFRVPPGLIGAKDSLNTGSLTSTQDDGDMTKLQRYGAEPVRMRLAAGLGRALLPDFGIGSTHRLWFDTSQILSLQEDTDQLHTRIRENWDASLMMLDEARMAMGLDPLPNKQGQVFKIPFSITMTPATDLAYALDSPAPGKPVSVTQVEKEPAALPTGDKRVGRGIEIRNGHTYRDLKTLSAREFEQRASVLTTTRKVRARLIQIGHRQIKKALTDQAERIAESIASKQAHTPGETRDFSAVDWAVEEREIAKVITRYQASNSEAAFNAINSVVSDDLVWSVNNPRVLKLLQELAKNVTGINDTTRLQVAEIIADAALEGQTLEAIAATVKETLVDASDARALMIARSESQVAYNKSSTLAYAESGEVGQVEFLDNPEHDTDPSDIDGLTCAERDGLVCDLSEADSHIDSEHPNGSLVVIPILSGESPVNFIGPLEGEGDG